jgi:hydrogenase/urease accessory protein HupE
MQTMCGRLAGMFAGLFLATVALAHPGHAPTDPVAQVSEPLAGADHFLAFLALTSLLLFAVRVFVKARGPQKQKARK